MPFRASEPEAIGHRLREAREFAGLSQAQAAKLMDMHRPTVSEIEAGRRKVSADEVAKFAKLYRVDVEWIVTGKDRTDSDDLRIQVAARQLKDMKPEDIDKLVRLLGALKRVQRGKDE